jgi:hypothetical protein
MAREQKRDSYIEGLLRPGSNLTPAFLIDELGKLSEAQNIIKRRHEFVRELLKARTKAGEELKGTTHTCTPEYQATERFSKEVMISRFGQDAYDQCYVVTESLYFRVKRVPTQEQAPQGE